MSIPPRPRPQKCTATIVSKVALTSKVFLVDFAMKEPAEIAFLPGQTFSLNVAPGVNRSMSISSPPSEKNHILMCHDVGPGGPGSQWTINHGVGDEATFMAPLGIFVMDPESHRKKVLVATGTGIAPYRSMLLDYLGKGGTDDITLYWGLRYEEDVYWVDEFQALAAKYPNFRFVLTLSQPTDAWQGKRGRVTGHVTQDESNLPGSDFYLCGNQAMIKDVEAQLTAHQVPPHQIYKELYF
jgi:CDP-4-dehydro-6-deoxyglucose reductase